LAGERDAGAHERRGAGERKGYHVVREFADEIGSCSALYAFRRRSDFAWREAVRMIDWKRYRPD
jgi:hypothetical protein